MELEVTALLFLIKFLNLSFWFTQAHERDSDLRVKDNVSLLIDAILILQVFFNIKSDLNLVLSIFLLKTNILVHCWHIEKSIIAHSTICIALHLKKIPHS